LKTSASWSRDPVAGSARRSRRFAQGARIQLVARTTAELAATRSELSQLTTDVRATTLDLLQPESAAHIVDEVRGAWGGLDILVSNAGATAPGGFLELDDSVWPAGFSLKMFANLRGHQARVATVERIARTSGHHRRRDGAHA
jgi:3-oxoacyl-[acyl-carrier protein] reductase